MPFQEGKSGNKEKVFSSENQPANRGRKKGSRNVSTILREMLEKIAPDEVINTKFVKEFCKGKKRVTISDAIAARLINEGLIKGESWAIKELMDRTEGRATERHELTGKNGEPLMKPVEDALLKIYGNAGK
jgi:hypothetical protein